MLLEVAYPQGSRIGIWKCWILRRRDDWSTRSTRRRDLNPGHIGGSRVLSLLRIPYCRSIHIVNKRVDGTLKIWIQCSARFPLVDDFAMPQHCFVRFIARHILVLMANNLVMSYIYLISLSRNRGRGGTYISDIGMCRPKGYGLGAFLVWKRYTLCPFWSGIRYGFGGSEWNYLSFQFQEIWEFEMDWKNFCLRELSNDGIISA